MIWILIFIYAAYTAWSVILSVLQIRFVNKRAAQPAVVLGENEFKNAAQIAIRNERFEIVNHIYGFFVLAVWSVWGVGYLQNAFYSGDGVSVLIQSLLVVAFLLINWAINLPFDAYKTLIKDRQNCFSTISVATFVMDQIKSALMTAILGGAVVYVAIFCWQFLGWAWWIWAWAFGFAVLVLAIFIYPIFIAPIFNKVTPLKDTELKSAIESLMNECGFRASGIFVMDASKRDRRLNAYFGGLGASKRVVLYDTLIAKLTQNEIIAVLAHELGHFRHNDILKGIISSAVILFIMLFICGNIPESVFGALKLSGDGASFILVLLLYGSVLSAVATPVMSQLSRKKEFAADNFAAAKRGAADMIAALKKLGDENRAFPLAHPLYSAVHHTHPSLYQRIKRLGGEDS